MVIFHSYVSLPEGTPISWGMGPLELIGEIYPQKALELTGAAWHQVFQNDPSQKRCIEQFYPLVMADIALV